MLVIFEQLFSPPTQAQTTLLYDTNYTTLWDRTALYTTLQFASTRVYSRSTGTPFLLPLP
jgi:hypothetical protein